MSLYITSLNSGSNGNCYYIGTATEAVLIDVGISCRETEKRLKQLGLSIKTVKAVFVSHEHGDHIKGVSTLANKYKLPVYISRQTAKHGPILIKHLTQHFTADVPVQLGDLTVVPFCKKHDAIDPYSFVIRHQGITIGVFTDIGTVCDQVIHYFKQCHAIFLEANYDEEMLEKGRYPVHLKNRIRGGQGHLSNNQALELFVKYRPSFMSHVLLSHLSKENNKPELAASLFTKYSANNEVIVASRDHATEIIRIQTNNAVNDKTTAAMLHPVQLVLF